MFTHLNLGCGNLHDSKPEWIHCDQTCHHPDVRLVADLEGLAAGQKLVYLPRLNCFEIVVDDRIKAVPEEEVPVGDLEKVVARDVLEHLRPPCIPGVIQFCWEHLKPGGTLEIQVPEHGSPNAVIDPTHYRGFHLRSFDMFDPATSFGRKSKFYGWHPWRLTRAERVPGSDVNLAFTLVRL